MVDNDGRGRGERHLPLRGSSSSQSSNNTEDKDLNNKDKLNFPSNRLDSDINNVNSFKKEREIEKITIKRILRKLWLPIVMQILHNVCGAIRMAIFFPYLRTTVHCATPLDPNIPRTSPEWSGSMHCGDRDYVGRVGQERVGYALGLNLLLQFVFISVLGAAGDSFGRKPILALSWFGYMAETLINTVSSEFPFIILGRVVQGITGAYSTMISSIIADISGTSEKGKYFAVHMALGNLATLIATVVTNFLIIRQYLYDYKTVWMWMSILSLAGLLLATFVLKETIHADKREPWTMKSINPCGSFSIVSQYPLLVRMVFILRVLIFCIMSVTIIPAYVIEVYSWTQDYAIYLQILGSLISTLSAAFSVSLIPKYGARKVIQASFAVLSVAQLFFVLSILSPVFLILANILNGSAFAATPAYYEEITRFIPQNEQGRIQSAFSGAFLIAAGLGAVFYGKLFQSLPAKLVYVPFLISFFASILIGLYLNYTFRQYPTGHIKARQSIQEIILAEIDREFSMDAPHDPSIHTYLS